MGAWTCSSSIPTPSGRTLGAVQAGRSHCDVPRIARRLARWRQHARASQRDERRAYRSVPRCAGGVSGSLVESVSGARAGARPAEGFTGRPVRTPTAGEPAAPRAGKWCRRVGLAAQRPSPQHDQRLGEFGPFGDDPGAGVGERPVQRHGGGCEELVQRTGRRERSARVLHERLR